MDWNNPEEVREYKRQYTRKYRRTPLGRANEMVKDFRRNDKKYERGECTITPEWIMENIFTSKCVYCGEDDWHQLGCDRIDNSKSHTPENVVCSCHRCNEKRGTIPFEEFVQRLKESEPLLKKNLPDKSKAVVAKDPVTLKVVYEFPSTREAGRNGFNFRNIAACCNGKRKTHKGLF